jgi:hypothetical protein
MIEKEFIHYEEALALKELGFDEPCLAGYNFKDRRTGQFTYPSAKEPNTTSEARVYHKDKKIVGAPLYQQAFSWLFQKLDIEKGVMPLDAESQKLLLKELIDKVSSKHLLV